MNEPVYSTETAAMGRRAMEEFIRDGDSAFEGSNMLSLETQARDYAEDSVAIYARANFPGFLSLLSGLRDEDQDLLVSYYVLGAAQRTLAGIFGGTQTMTSFRLKAAAGALCSMVGGKPSQKRLHACLSGAKLEGSLGVPLSRLIAEYEHCRSYEQVAEMHPGLHRPAIRRSMRRASDTLHELPGAEGRAVGAYIHSLIEGTDRAGRPPKRTGNIITRSDPATLGEFRIRAGSPEFKAWFIGRAQY
jgi:hypothetical protein